MKFNKEKYNARSEILKAIAHPTRLWITEILVSGEKCVCEFTNNIEVDFSTVSKHLNVLKKAGIISSEKRGKNVYYTLNTPCLLNFISCVDNVIKQNAKYQKKIADNI